MWNLAARLAYRGSASTTCATHATLALQAGIHPKVVSKRLGQAQAMEDTKPPQAASACADTRRLQGLCENWLLG